MARGNGRGAWSARWAFVELFALSGVAVTQPFLDLVARNREILVSNGTGWGSAVALALLVALVPPAVGVLAEWALGLLWPKAVPWLHATLATALVAIVVVQALESRTPLGPRALLGLALLLGVGFGVLLLRFRIVGTFLHWLAIASVAFVPLFLFASPATDVLTRSTEAAATAGVARTPHRVVLIVLDELPTISLLDGTGHIDRQLFPHLAALADESVFYRNHTAVAGFTAASVPAILSGVYPDTSVFGTYANYPNNLFTLIGDRARLNVSEVVTRLCPQDLCPVRGGGLGSLFDATSRLWWDSVTSSQAGDRFEDRDAAIASVDAATSFVRSLRPTHGLHLDMIHLELPHYPWDRMADLRRYSVPEAPPGEDYPFQPWSEVATAGRVRHILQLQAADTMVGRVEARLRRMRQFDDSMIVLTADHGIAFTPGRNMRQVSSVTMPQIMWAPLVVKYPGNAGRGTTDDRAAQSIDVVPTIADVVGLRMGYAHPGASLRAAPVDRPTRRFYPTFWTAKPPGGGRAVSAYVDAGTAADFASVVRYRTAPAGGDPAVRPFRIGPYGVLVGRRTAGLATAPRVDVTAGLVDPQRLHRVDTRSDPLPWVWNNAVLSGATPGSWFAVSSGGTILAVTQAVRDPTGQVTATFLLPPALVHSGRLRLTMDRITGPAAAPTLAAVALR